MVDPLDPAVPATSLPLTLGLYIDKFVHFSKDPVVKQKLDALLSQPFTVEFMGTVECFLGTHFQWLATDDVVTIHLSQTGFAAHLIEDNNVHTPNMTPDATLYYSDLPINTIPK